MNCLVGKERRGFPNSLQTESTPLVSGMRPQNVTPMARGRIPRDLDFPCMRISKNAPCCTSPIGLGHIPFF
jgi:hypothetical protein